MAIRKCDPIFLEDLLAHINKFISVLCSYKSCRKVILYGKKTTVKKKKHPGESVNAALWERIKLQNTDILLRAFSELLICMLHQFGLGCIKNGAL